VIGGSLTATACYPAHCDGKNESSAHFTSIGQPNLSLAVEFANFRRWPTRQSRTKAIPMLPIEVRPFDFANLARFWDVIAGRPLSRSGA
jgi:hypothetical protein